MKKQKNKDILTENVKGNALLITTIILLILTVIVAACLNISGMQFDLAVVERNTSNTYYLAKSGIEKQVDAINKALETEMVRIIRDLGRVATTETDTSKTVYYDSSDKDRNKTYIEQLSEFESSDVKAKKLDTAEGKSGIKKYDNFEYVSTTSSALTGRIQVKNEKIKDRMQREIYIFVRDNFLKKDGTNKKNEISYTIKSDGQSTEYETHVVITLKPIKLDGGEGEDATLLSALDQTLFKATATATAKKASGDIYDTQTVEAIIDIHLPNTLTNQILEEYVWAFGNAPEILDSALICFSDVHITGGATLEIDGDLQVKGQQKNSNIVVSTAGPSGVIDIASSEIVDVEQSGGVIVTNEGKLVVNGNLNTISNVMASNGWGATEYAPSPTPYATLIEVEDDLIAHTVAIVDDYYSGSTYNQSPFNPLKQGTHIGILVGKNVMVENDVMIDRWVNTSDIDVGGSIFGISDGTAISYGGGKQLVDPNTSSGIFSQGISTTISANGMFVNGQPFITLSANSLPLKLYESIGEPFDGVASWEGYETNEEKESNKSYLTSDSPFLSLIKGDKIKTSFSRTFVPSPSMTSAIDIDLSTPTAQVGKVTNAILNDNNVAKQFFYQGTSSNMKKIYSDNGGAPATDSLSIENNIYKKVGSTEYDYDDTYYILNQRAESFKYYLGERTYAGKLKMYNKKLTDKAVADIITDNVAGLKGYMIAMRSVFFKNYKETMTFDEVIGTLPAVRDWSYENPVWIKKPASTATETLDISTLYVKEGAETNEKPIPSIIINSGTGTLKLTASDNTKNEFHGIIISKGKVEVADNMTIYGNVMIGGNEASSTREEIMTGASSCLKIAAGKKLKIVHNSTKAAAQGSLSTDTILKAQQEEMLDGNAILNIAIKNRDLKRAVLDALKITQYRKADAPSTFNTDLKTILQKYDYNGLSYTLGKVFISEDSVLEVDTSDIDVRIKTLKKK